MYFIFENTKLVYIGPSGTNLYKTILRHFQKWSDTRQLRRVSYKDKIGRYSFTFAVRLMNKATKEAIEAKEYALVNRYKPRDNKLNLYCSITGQDCESKVKKAAARLPKKKKAAPKKKKPKKQDLIDDVPF
ncbi:hypothetical protein [Aureispira anguillae]|uniref:GIY-YIG domain-containing protein n=1 Tax=Aureispira anguillae TaxID=2864201 RepID=A0A915YHB7_9BACT|nr:hypothetical protein [Aureispira anguillae]BDS13190.1 hypothetical protein AsAng_0039180 [Aureispira anguillae]